MAVATNTESSMNVAHFLLRSVAKEYHRVVRIISGHLRGRRLVVPRGTQTRPTSDRVREALFSMLGPLDSLRVADLYAGTGAVGIEALSRGAAHAVFVESAPAALTKLRQNLALLQLSEVTTLVPRTLETSVPTLLAQQPFDLVWADPPYHQVREGQAPRALARLLGSGLLGIPGRLVLEHATVDAAPVLSSLLLAETRSFGDTALSFYVNHAVVLPTTMNNPIPSMPPPTDADAVPPSSGATTQYVVLAAGLVLAMGGLLLWKFMAGSSPPSSSTPALAISAMAASPKRTLEDAPPPPPTDEEAPAAVADSGKKKVGSTAPSTCGGPCSGTAPSGLQSDVQGRAGRARGCYERAMRQNGDLQGSMTVSLRIDPSGVVCSASVADDSVGSPEVSSCIVGMFRGQKLSAAPTGGCVDMRVPMRFQAKR